MRVRYACLLGLSLLYAVCLGTVRLGTVCLKIIIFKKQIAQELTPERPNLYIMRMKGLEPSRHEDTRT